MSITNQLSRIGHDDQIVSLDQRYTDFLNALSEITDETMRNRCHKYWTSLYHYFDRSMINERVLRLEEKRTCEILERLDIEMNSRQSEVTYQVHNIIERGHQVLADIRVKYNIRATNERQSEQNLNDIEFRIGEHKSENRINTVSSSTSLHQIRKTIDNLTKTRMSDII
jgi:hypothetical protein